MGPLLLAIPFVRCDDELVLYLMTYHSHCFVRPRSRISVAVVNGGLWRWICCMERHWAFFGVRGLWQWDVESRFLDAEEAMKHLRGCESTEKRA